MTSVWTIATLRESLMRDRCGKAALLLDHLVAVSKKICSHPSFALAIDEMMKRFKGRSGQTARERMATKGTLQHEG